MKISKWMKGLLAFLLSFSVMFTTMIQQSVVRADEGSVDPAEVIEEETPASSPEAAPTAEAVEAQTVSEPAAAAEETAEPAVQPAETPAVQETAPPTESTSVPEEQVQTVKETPVVTQEEAPAETQAYVSPASFDAEQDNIKVHADTAEGAFSEPVTLIVSLLDEDSDDYKKVQETMDQTGSSVDGLLALDIRFENSSGQEVEPVGQVSVSVVMKDAAGDVIDQSSLQVTHIKEEADGSLTPEKVADNDENTEGYIRTAGNDIQADFVAESFSTFVISRAKGTSSKTYFTDTYGTPIAENDNLTRDQSGSNLTTVNTVDSMSKGFHIYLVDMDELWNYAIGSYKSTGMLSQGIYGRTLRNQYPYFVANGTSLRSEFANKTEVNHLFYESTYSATGYFYFNSAETFASLQSNGTFLVSRELGSPSSESAFYYQRGNFLPYNSLNLNRVINHNLYDDQGNPLSPSAPRYNENLYRMQQKENFGFGMHATAEFYQPVNGQVNGGEDMVYEFTGDDDMLVYIDGVLVLDLGGIHDAQSGSINFRTGTVTYTNINNKDNRDYGSSTTIHKQFELARQLGSTTWSGNTFAAGTSHKIDIFYMERGKGASNLKMKVNIPPVPDGSVAVTKQVEGLDAAQAADETYRMQLNIDGNPAADREYTLSDNPDEILHADGNGQFVLKAGQTAVFSQIGAGKTVRVKEIVDKNTIYDVSYRRWDSAGNEISNDTITVPSAGHVSVTVKNNAAEHTNDLTITKQFMMNGQDVSGVIDMAAFQNATFKLQESKDNGSNWKDLYTISYSSFQNKSYTFSQLDPRSQYRVIENLTETTNGSNVSYSYNGTVSSFNGTNGNATSPVISLRDGDAAVVFTNNYGTQTYPLTIRKSFDGIESLPSNFQITIDGSTEVFTVANKKGGSGTAEDPYWWSTDAAYNSTLTIRESGYETDNYELAAGTETSRQVTIGSDSNVVEFENHYVPKTYSFTLVKKFVGITKDEIPQNFQIEGNGKTYVLDDGTPSEDGLTYTWTDSAAYRSTLTFTESKANVTGYSLTASNNGSAEIKIKDSGNTAEITNTYSRNNYTVTVTKVFEGLDSDADLSNFEMQANVNGIVTAKKISEDSGDGTVSNPYIWTFEAPYKSTVTFEEANYQIKGFSRTNNDATTKSITVSAFNEINKVSFTNVYQKNTGEDVNELPTLNILKKDNKGNALSQAEFTLFDPDGNAVWHDVTNKEGKLSVDFSNYTFSANQTSYQFTLKETRAPEGYDGSSEIYHFTVNLQDNDPEIKYNERENAFQRFYHWLVGNETSASYDAASSTLTVVNTINQYPYKIVKTFSGVEALPETFEITDQNGRKYTLKDKDPVKQDNTYTYTWTGTADFGTEFQLREGNAKIHGYDLASTVNGQNGTSGTLQITTGENKIVFHNDYTAQPKKVTVSKQFNGLRAEEIPAGFAISGLGENLTLENKDSVSGSTYTWIREAAFGEQLTLRESGYEVSGYQVSAVVDGKPGTSKELTVGDDNTISFVNSYEKKYDTDDVTKPSFTIHKVDQDGRPLAGAVFSLLDAKDNVIWTAVTDGKNDLTADFTDFDFGTDPGAKFSFTLHEDAPIGYTGAEDWTITVSEDDGVVSLRKESDEDFFHKIYNWLIKDSFDKAYDQTSKVLTVTNTVNSYDFTVTKSFTGVEALPEDFQIRDTLGNVYTLDDAKSANGTYTWTGKADYGTKVTFTENGYQVNGYDVTTSVNGKDGTSAEITIGTSNNNVDFVNSYEAGTYMVRVTKSFTGVDELPDTFAITGAGENALTAADAVSGTGTADDPYVWNVEAKFGTILNIAETGYETEGYDVTATVNGNAGTSMQIQVGTGSNNVAFNNAYSLKKTDVILTASKNLTGRDLKAGEFSFEAYEGDQLVAEGTNDADGNITFSTIHDVTYGSHTYTLKEVNQGLGGMTYDDNAYEVTVEVIDQDGTAKAVLPETKPVFTNTYSAQDGSAVIEARKNLTGRDAQNGEFSFELVQDGKTIATAVNEDGKVVFGPISWTMDEVGTYTYTIRETAGKDKNVVYDSHEETVTVTVSDNGDGTLLIETAYDKDGAVFENMYEPPVPHTDDDPKPSPEPSAPPSSDPSPVPAVPHTDDNGKTTGSSRTPQTGVSTDVTTWAWIGSSSLLALFIALILRRRKEESK